MYFINALVPAETHGDLKIRKNCLHNVLDAVGPSEGETVHVRSPH